MKEYTVIVDDDCGTALGYQFDAPSADAAATFAEDVFNAHRSSAGRAIFVFEGKPIFTAFHRTLAPSILDLRISTAA